MIYFIYHIVFKLHAASALLWYSCENKLFALIFLLPILCDNIFRQSCIFFVYFQLSECTKQIYFENITWPYLTFLFTLRHYCSGVWRFPVDVNQRKIIQCKLNQQLKSKQLGAQHKNQDQEGSLSGYRKCVMVKRAEGQGHPPSQM